MSPQEVLEKRAAAVGDEDLGVVLDVSQALSATPQLRTAFAKAMQILAQRRGVRRASLLLLDEATGQLRLEAAFGLSPDETEKARYLLGEGVTGIVVATGRAKVIADVRQDPSFLNRTGGFIAEVGDAPVSFLCIPVRVEGRVCGALSVGKVFESEESLARDHALLEVISTLVAHCVQLGRKTAVHREELLSQAVARSELREKFRFDNIIGDSPAMLEVFSTVGQVANSRATVLLLGETGTGKEMIAKAIHQNSPRRHNAFVRVNCGALTGTLLESELFGHVKGSFTGAIKDKIGRFEAADGGTIFLDEIGTLEPELQVKLLRVLQEREFERVGDTHTLRINVRVIAATNVDLQEEVARGTFREDLYYRLNVVSIYLPPLRNRREDIPRLIDFFLDRYNKINERDLSRISRDILSDLLRYSWPGNVRELENAIERAVVLSRGDEFTEDLLPLAVRMFAAQHRNSRTSESIDELTRRLASLAVAEFDTREGEIYQIVVDQVERALIQRSLEKCGGVKVKAADYLGINRNTLNKKVKDLGIETDEG
jgi:Nif-specific regulatory protein